MQDMKPQEAIDHFGSQLALAQALGLEQPSISLWVKNGVIPPIRQLEIEVHTCGLLMADENIPRGWVQPKQVAA